ncbi:MAG: cation:proton antiporter [Betaproteobacteria bacterium]|nr:cation:proton antiporter [Betaproteobacteria bacterium]
MEETGNVLSAALLLLTSGVLAVVACRALRWPPIVGYVLVGIALGPGVLGLLPEREAIGSLAEFGVVFLMFSIGLEFSLPKLIAMRRLVLGLGSAQVAATLAIGVAGSLAAGLGWQAGLAIGGALAMSSTAIVSKLLAERAELETPHGREVIGVLLFQDLAVVPLLVLIPALGQPAERIGAEVVFALLKAAAVLAALLLAGPAVMRAWLGLVARRQSTELFVLNVLLITLGLAYLTSLAGLSLVLGAFLAGMLISETQFRFQVEEDIKPFRDVLLGLFFVTVGMMLDPAILARHAVAVVSLFLAIVVGKFGVVLSLSRFFGSPSGTALRTGLALAQAGEFGFVLLSLAASARLAGGEALQPLLAAMVLSMLAAPALIGASNRIALRWSRSEWMERSLELHRVAVQSLEAERHVVILGYGRNGQRLARLLEAEGVRYVALDLDPERVREARAAGDTVVFADSVRREALAAAGAARAAAVAITFADAAAAVKVLAHVHELNAAVPVVVRAREESDIERLKSAGASEVVPEAFESGVMLASHTLVLVGVPLSRVMRRMSVVRSEQYDLLRGLFPGGGEAADAGLRLHSVGVGPASVGKTLGSLRLESLGVEVRAVRRRSSAARLSPGEAGSLEPGDVVVLLGAPDALEAAEDRLLQGG